MQQTRLITAQLTFEHLIVRKTRRRLSQRCEAMKDIWSGMLADGRVSEREWPVETGKMIDIFRDKGLVRDNTAMRIFMVIC